MTSNPSGGQQDHSAGEEAEFQVERPAESDSEGLEEDQEEDQEEDEFDANLAFIQVPGPSDAGAGQPRAGPSRQGRRRTAIQLDDDEDTRVEDIDETAGEITGHGETVREDWRRHFARQAEEKRTSGKGKCA